MNMSVPNATQTPPTINASIPLSRWEIKGDCFKVKKRTDWSVIHSVKKYLKELRFQ